MRFLLCSLPVCMCLALCGCDENVYEVALRQEGSGLVRELTCWRWDPDVEGKPVKPFPAEELKRIANAYEQAAPVSEARKYAFAGIVDQWMPDDIGGAGWYAQYATRMGTSFAYSERFRGSDDFAERQDRQLGAADRLMDIMLTWLDAEMNGRAGWAELRAFLDRDVRRDLRNLALYWISCRLAIPGECSDCSTRDGGKNALNQTLFRLLHALMERGYITPSQLPVQARLWAQMDASSAEQKERWIAAELKLMLETRTGERFPGTEVMSSLRSLLGSDTPLAGLRDYLETLPEWAPFIDAWEEKRQGNPQLPPPDSLAVIGGLFTAILSSPDVGAPGRLEVTLACPSEPVETNGHWDADTSNVLWSGPINSVERLPTCCYAFWTVPDSTFQVKHFGRTVLEGDPLLEYTFKASQLSSADRDAWDSFLDTLTPAGLRAEKIRTFRFPDQGKGRGDGRAVPELLAAALDSTAP
ncbi:MAG: hypothetical protein HN742_35990 [Lentisphaerae bacterium]|nr:hypothetical protein [Lentisphaerota bacterium]MBT5606980.1 hypothetical protein [Lentisphaerota bacterium]MBT7056913.1 hypothetical protein [Lentisphaerota bacterium]MBT7847327.1 hypothetical protein [Lentisphaerota bacterium]